MQTNHITVYMKYLIEECYLEDYNPLYAEFWYDNYSYHYTFMEWYFLYRKWFNLKKIKNISYKHTPTKLTIRSCLI